MTSILAFNRMVFVFVAVVRSAKNNDVITIDQKVEQNVIASKKLIGTVAVSK
jgi:hypothetical protein